MAGSPSWLVRTSHPVDLLASKTLLSEWMNTVLAV